MHAICVNRLNSRQEKKYSIKVTCSFETLVNDVANNGNRCLAFPCVFLPLTPQCSPERPLNALHATVQKSAI